jgi:hypothetical protein
MNSDYISRIRTKIIENNNHNIPIETFDKLVYATNDAIYCYKKAKLLIYHDDIQKRINACDDILVKCYVDILSKNVP